MEMSSALESLQKHLSKDDLESFFVGYERYVQTNVFEPSCMAITQVALPSALRRGFDTNAITAKTIVMAWKLAQSGQLLLVENDIRILINQRIDEAMKTLQVSTDQPAKPLAVFVDEKAEDAGSSRGQRVRLPLRDTVEVKRVSIVSTFAIRTWSACSAFDLRRNLCDSGQEKEFLRAIRQYFPAMLTYPNMTLRSFIDLDELGTAVPDSFRQFAWRSRVDVLLCTHDEDPVAGFELDSRWHDAEAASRRDEMKDFLFQMAGIPLIRIRPANPGDVRAEDFYDLLKAEQLVDLIRPYRMRPRRAHDGLVPASSDAIRR